MYSGKDRKHALKYQAINSPDGLIVHLAGPYPGSRHDQFMLHDSHILEWIRQFPDHPEHDTPYVIYADAGYARTTGIEIPYHDAELNASHDAFNQAMSASRISVEWAFGAILHHWASLRYVPQQKLLSNGRIGQIYFVAALLTNFLNCLRPNQTSQYFNLQPPSLTYYIAAMTTAAGRGSKSGLQLADSSSSSS
jgi:nuclease HARBI1